MGRAEALERQGAWTTHWPCCAIWRGQPDLAPVHAALGDTLRRAEQCEEAVDSYTEALDRVDTEQSRYWFLFYTRAICYHLTDDWPPAEADFRKALELNPGQPQVLNYLGYSLVEQRRNLDEALDMIERAVAARPDSGFIVDSLAWVYYRLGRFDEAVEPMERAAELLPTDPIINDHLGDVYWMVGREREARFQWERALSLDPAEEDADRIRLKLDIGLDAVLEAEGGVGESQ
jgi:Flp pilus assembly protein TadD